MKIDRAATQQVERLSLIIAKDREGSRRRERWKRADRREEKRKNIERSGE